MQNPHHNTLVAFALAVALTSCRSTTEYTPAPLPEDVVAALLAERDARTPPRDPLTLARAVTSMSAHGPDVRDAIARYHTALARAEIPTPWPNPGLSLGLEGAQGKNVDTNRVVPFADVSITIPSGDRLARQDDLHAALAESARIDALATFREVLLELRGRLVALAIAHERAALSDELVAAAEASVKTSNALVVAGGAAALDVSSFELDLARERGVALDTLASVVSASADVARLVGVTTDDLGDVSELLFPTPPSAVPSWPELERLVVTENAQLFRLRGEHAVAEQAVRLEIARQYPDLVLGTSLGAEAGERQTRYGLSLGWTLPIFDRNEQSIAQARAARDEIATRYESAARRIVSDVERALAQIERARERRAWLEHDVLPAARRHGDIARRSLEAGASGALELLDAARSLRTVRAEALDAQLAEHMAWLALERAVGVPLTTFPSDASLAPPAELTVDADASDEGDS